MTTFTGRHYSIMIAAILAGCGNEIDPVIDGRAGAPVVLDSVSGDSVLAYHPTLPSAPGDTVSVPDTTKIPVPPPTPADSVSPTGRAPRLVWTPERQGIWNRMRDENHPLFQLVRSNCQAAKNGNPRYGDRGQWCTIYYQMTGDLPAARTAWSQLSAAISSVQNANDVREYFTESVILYDWLFPALSSAERQTAVNSLERWAEYTLGINTPTYTGGTRAQDSDATTGYYFGLVALDLVGENTVPGTRRWRNERVASQSLPQIPVGGLDATASDYSSLRNAISAYVAASAGGEWLESDHYNQGTLKLLMLGAEAVRTATGVDHFPEVTQFLADAARMQTFHVTSDLTEGMQWGDEQNPRQFVGRLFKRVTMLGMLAGIAEGTPQAAEAGGLVQALFTRYGTTGYGSAEPWARILFLYNPYAVTANWSRPGTSAYSSGRGYLLVRQPASSFSIAMSLPNNADHTVYAFGSFQLHRNGEWAITHPLGYGFDPGQGESQNTLLVAGLSSMPDRQVIAQQSGPSWWSVSGRTRGSYYDAGYYNPPPAFLRDWTRSVVYLTRGGVDWIVTVDDVDASHPESLSKFDRYRSADQARIRGTPLVEWIVHMPEAPTPEAGDRFRWRTPGGQPVIVHRIDPAPPWRVIDERTLWATSNSFSASEKRFQLRIQGPAAGGRMVHAISVGDENPPQVVSIPGGIQFGNTQVTVTNGQVSVVN